MTDTVSTKYRIEDDGPEWDAITDALPLHVDPSVRTRLDTIRETLGLLRRDIVTRDSSLAVLQKRVVELDSELDAFKDAVREAAITAAKDNGLCGKGLNEWLENLGLDPVKQRVRVRVRETAARWLEFDIEVVDPDDEDEVSEATESEWDGMYQGPDFDEDNELEYDTIEVLS